MQLSKGHFVAITSSPYIGPGEVTRVSKRYAPLRGLILQYAIDQVAFVRCNGQQLIFLHNPLRGWINPSLEHVIINACEIGRGAS